MSAVDRVLAVLDVGMQTSQEHGYGTDRAPDRCSRCQAAEPVEDGDLCEGCRAYLLGDADLDPTLTAHRSVYSGLAAAIISEDEARRRLDLPPRINHANGLPVIGGSIDGSCVAAEGHHMEVPIFRPMSYRVDAEPDPFVHFERDLYRRERFAAPPDRMFWAWVHTSLSGQEAARRIIDMNIC